MLLGDDSLTEGPDPAQLPAASRPARFEDKLKSMDNAARLQFVVDVLSYASVNGFLPYRLQATCVENDVRNKLKRVYPYLEHATPIEYLRGLVKSCRRLDLTDRPSDALASVAAIPPLHPRDDPAIVLIKVTTFFSDVNNMLLPYTDADVAADAVRVLTTLVDKFPQQWREHLRRDLNLDSPNVIVQTTQPIKDLQRVVQDDIARLIQSRGVNDAIYGLSSSLSSDRRRTGTGASTPTSTPTPTFSYASNAFCTTCKRRGHTADVCRGPSRGTTSDGSTSGHAGGSSSPGAPSKPRCTTPGHEHMAHTTDQCGEQPCRLHNGHHKVRECAKGGGVKPPSGHACTAGPGHEDHWRNACLALKSKTPSLAPPPAKSGGAPTRTGSVKSVAKPSVSSADGAAAADDVPRHGRSLPFFCYNVTGKFSFDSGADGNIMSQRFYDAIDPTLRPPLSPAADMRLGDGETPFHIVGTCRLPFRVYFQRGDGAREERQLDVDFNVASKLGGDDVLIGYPLLNPHAKEQLFMQLFADKTVNFFSPHTATPAAPPTPSPTAGLSVRRLAAGPLQHALSIAKLAAPSLLSSKPDGHAATPSPTPSAAASAAPSSAGRSRKRNSGGLPSPFVPKVRALLTIATIATLAAMGPLSPADPTAEDLRAAVTDRPEAPSFRDKAAAVLAKHAKVFGSTPAPYSELTLPPFDLELREPGVLPHEVSHPIPIRHDARDQMKAQLDEWATLGIIEWVADSERAHGFIFPVKKSNGKIRITANTVHVNAATKPQYTAGHIMPPNMHDLAHSFRGKDIYFKFDFREGFTILPLGEQASQLLTFCTHWGKIRYRRGCYGPSSIPLHFHKVVREHIVRPSVNGRYGDTPHRDLSDAIAAEQWVDDILAGATLTEDNVDTIVEWLDRFLSLVSAAGGRLNLTKCALGTRTGEMVGLLIDGDSVRIDPSRVSDLLNLPAPSSLDSLRSALGVAGFYRWAVPPDVFQPRWALLQELNRPTVRMKTDWTPAHDAAWRELKEAIVAAAPLALPDFTRDIYLKTDANLHNGYGVILTQFDPITGVPRPIAFKSVGWTDTQLRNWSANVKEAYALRQGLCEFAHKFAPGVRIIIESDHKNHLNMTSSPDHRVQRWCLDIAEFPHAVYYIPGAVNAADHPSRLATPTPAYPTSVLHHALPRVASRATASPDAAEPATADDDALESDVIPSHDITDPVVYDIISAQLKAPATEREAWKTEPYTTTTFNGTDVVRFDGRLLVPRGAVDIKNRLLDTVHDYTLHRGTRATLHALRNNLHVHWVGIDNDVANYVKSCPLCQINKSPHQPSNAGKLHPTLPRAPNDTWYVDYKGPLPSGGSLFVLVDGFTRFTSIDAIKSATGTESVRLLETYALQFGYPRTLRCDNGSHFACKAVRKWCNDHNVSFVVGVPHHPQGQGIVETRMRPIADMLKLLLFRTGNLKPSVSVSDAAKRIAFTINTTVCAPLGMTPYRARYGVEARTGLSAKTDTFLRQLGYTDEEWDNGIAAFHAHLSALHDAVRTGSAVSQLATKLAYDASHTEASFSVGDYVLVHFPSRPHKFETFFRGPYKVGAIERDDIYVCEKLLDPTTTYRAHVSRLRPFDMSRSSEETEARRQLAEGYELVKDVTSHRETDDEGLELEVVWANGVTAWAPASDLVKNRHAKDYASKNGLKLKAVTKRSSKRAASAAASAAIASTSA